MRSKSGLMSMAALTLGLAIVVAACSSAAATPTGTVAGETAMPATAAPAESAMASAAESAMAPASLTIGSTSDATLGDYLTGENGMTLYVFTKDSADTSTCTSTCAAAWPPLLVSAGSTINGPSGATGAFATITRADGTLQVTYNQMPLYSFASDSNAGDTTGQGKNGVWFVAPLSGSLASPSSSATAASGY